MAEIADQHPWQPILWRELYAYTREQGHSIYHRANLYQRFIEQLASGDFDRSTWPKRLFIFGISALPPVILMRCARWGAYRRAPDADQPLSALLGRYS